jgi:hypothetical protein
MPKSGDTCAHYLRKSGQGKDCQQTPAYPSPWTVQTSTPRVSWHAPLYERELCALHPGMSWPMSAKTVDAMTFSGVCDRYGVTLMTRTWQNNCLSASCILAAWASPASGRPGNYQDPEALRAGGVSRCGSCGSHTAWSPDVRGVEHDREQHLGFVNAHQTNAAQHSPTFPAPRASWTVKET